MSKEGRVSVQFKSDSMFLGSNVPVEVRDSSMRLVKQSRYDRQFNLPAGLYEVSAVLEDGNKHSQLVLVREDETVPVELEVPAADQVSKSMIEDETVTASVYQSPRFTRSMATRAGAGPVMASPTSGATQFLDCTGAELISEASGLWLFRPAADLDAVATARFAVDERTVLISLPVSPEHGPTENSCAVKIEETKTGPHVTAWFATERTVANALQNMLSSGYILKAADVADEAIDLLRYKYSDPTGAALGALILHKTGRLRKFTGWVKNLASDFDWLPDGKVLLAHLLYENEAERTRAFELAIQASQQRMLFTESFSLLLDILRRWPTSSDIESTQKAQAIDSLATYSPYIDWESICLSNTIEEEEEES